MTLNEKAAYIKGLADGLDFDKTSPEGKIIAALLDLVSDITDELEAVNDDLIDLQEYIEEVDEDLADVEDFLEEEFDECYDECEDCDCDCDDCDCDCENLGEGFYEVECPSCGENVCFDESIDPEQLKCPACGEEFSCDFEDEE